MKTATCNALLLFAGLLCVAVLTTTCEGVPLDAALDLPTAIHAKNHTNTTAGNSTTPAGNTTNGTKNGTTAAANPCFPAVATVQLLDKRHVRMSDLRVGDSVLVSVNPHNIYSEVFMFTHNEVSTVNEFVRITTAGGKAIMLSRNHYIHANGVLKVGGDVRPGDTLYTDSDSSDIVQDVSTVWEKGLYNPQTRHGDIYVDGIKASTYTQAVDACFAHALLAPLRAAFSRGFSLAWNNNVADMASSKFGPGRPVIA